MILEINNAKKKKKLWKKSLYKLSVEEQWDKRKYQRNCYRNL